jgi:hypothetical protein
MAGLSPEEEAIWIEQSMKDGEHLDIEIIEKSELVQKLLSEPENEQVGICKYGNTDIRYKPLLTKKLRHMLSKAQKEIKLSEDALQVQDNLVYSALAEICMDKELKNPDAWQLIDLRSKDGRVYAIFKEIMTKVGAGEDSLKSFR